MLSDPHNLNMGSSAPPDIVPGAYTSADELVYDNSLITASEIGFAQLMAHEFGHLIGLGHGTLVETRSSLIGTGQDPFGGDTSAGVGTMRPSDYLTLYNAPDPSGGFLYRDSASIGNNLILSRFAVNGTTGPHHLVETWGDGTDGTDNDPRNSELLNPPGAPANPLYAVHRNNVIPGDTIGHPILLQHVGTPILSPAYVSIEWALLYDADVDCRAAVDNPSRRLGRVIYHHNHPIINGNHTWAIKLAPTLRIPNPAPLSKSWATKPRLCAVAKILNGTLETSVADNTVISDEAARFHVLP